MITTKALIDLFNKSKNNIDFLNEFKNLVNLKISSEIAYKEISKKEIKDSDKLIFEKYVMIHHVITLQVLNDIIVRFVYGTGWTLDSVTNLSKPKDVTNVICRRDVDDKKDEEILTKSRDFLIRNVEVGMVFFRKGLQHFILVTKVLKTEFHYVVLTSNSKFSGIEVISNFVTNKKSYLAKTFGIIDLGDFDKSTYCYHIPKNGKMMKIVRDFIKKTLRNF